jgi:hypothetical protein
MVSTVPLQEATRTSSDQEPAFLTSWSPPGSPPGTPRAASSACPFWRIARRPQRKQPRPPWPAPVRRGPLTLAREAALQARTVSRAGVWSRLQGGTGRGRLEILRGLRVLQRGWVRGLTALQETRELTSAGLYHRFLKAPSAWGMLALNKKVLCHRDFSGFELGWTMKPLYRECFAFTVR